jgi:prophage regulatory protein
MVSNLKKSDGTDAPKFLRLPQVLERIPVCPSVWWLGIKKGIYPAGVKLSANTTAWHSSDIDELIERLWKGGAA